MKTDDTISYADSTSSVDDHREYVPYLAVAFHCRRPMSAPARLGLAQVERVVLHRGSRRRFERGDSVLKMWIDDDSMSSDHAELQRAGSEWQIRDLGSKNGTNVNGQRIAEPRALSDGDVVLAGHTVFVFRAPGGGVDGRGPVDVVSETSGLLPPALRTLNVQLHSQFDRLPQLARSEVAVLISGATGTGKELVARSVHELSGRTGKFVAVNCGALAPNLLESELFGHTKGAFSGATEAKLGLVRNAQGGTLFLDEVSEMSTSSQVSLLRTIQEREVRPVGAADPLPVDVRFVAATNRSVDELLAKDDFRDDLFARLAGDVVSLPPLAQRREDIGVLAGRLLSRALSDGTAKVRIKRNAAEALFLYDWPHNVRELEQVLSAAVSVKAGDSVRLEDVPARIRDALDARQNATVLDSGQRDRHEQLVAALRQHSGNVRAVARDMDKAPTQIYRWCKQLDIDIDSFRDTD